MTTLKHRMMRTGNRIGVWVHHALKGRLDDPRSGHVLMITTPGRRTGLPRSTMVRYLDHDGGYLVWGTGSGSPVDPDWFRNLRKADRARIEIGTAPGTVRPEILTGAERDRVWQEVVLAQVPEVSKYEAQAGRTIPVALLHPVGE